MILMGLFYSFTTLRTHFFPLSSVTLTKYTPAGKRLRSTVSCPPWPQAVATCWPSMLVTSAFLRFSPVMENMPVVGLGWTVAKAMDSFSSTPVIPVCPQRKG